MYILCNQITSTVYERNPDQDTSPRGPWAIVECTSGRICIPIVHKTWLHVSYALRKLFWLTYVSRKCKTWHWATQSKMWNSTRPHQSNRNMGISFLLAPVKSTHLLTSMAQAQKVERSMIEKERERGVQIFCVHNQSMENPSPTSKFPIPSLLGVEAALYRGSWSECVVGTNRTPFVKYAMEWRSWKSKGRITFVPGDSCENTRGGVKEWNVSLFEFGVPTFFEAIQEWIGNVLLWDNTLKGSFILLGGRFLLRAPDSK